MRFSIGAGMLLGALFLSGTAAAEEPRKMTLADCVREAQTHNPDVQSAGFDQEAARAQRWEAGGHFGPLVHVDAGVQQWDSQFKIAFPPNPPFVVRDAFTWSFTASAIQPLTGLFAIYEQ